MLFCLNCYEDALDDAVLAFDKVASACNYVAFLCYRVFKFAVNSLNYSCSILLPAGFEVVGTHAVENSGGSFCADCDAC